MIRWVRQRPDTTSFSVPWISSVRKETLRVEIFSSVTKGNRKETGRMIDRDREGVSVRGRQRKKRERDRKRESQRLRNKIKGKE